MCYPTLSPKAGDQGGAPGVCAIPPCRQKRATRVGHPGFVLSHPVAEGGRPGWGTWDLCYPTLSPKTGDQGGAPGVCAIPPCRQRRATRVGHPGVVLSHPVAKGRRQGWGTRESCFPTLSPKTGDKGGAPGICAIPPCRQKRATRVGHPHAGGAPEKEKDPPRRVLFFFKL